MAGYHVLWTDRAIKTAGEVVKYLNREWSAKEADQFLDKIDEVISTIRINPKLFRASVKKPRVHLVVIKRRTLLVYQVRPLKKQVVLLVFWNTRKNPKKLNY